MCDYRSACEPRLRRREVQRESLGRVLRMSLSAGKSTSDRPLRLQMSEVSGVAKEMQCMSGEWVTSGQRSRSLTQTQMSTMQCH